MQALVGIVDYAKQGYVSAETRGLVLAERGIQPYRETAVSVPGNGILTHYFDMLTILTQIGAMKG